VPHLPQNPNWIVGRLPLKALLPRQYRLVKTSSAFFMKKRAIKFFSEMVSSFIVSGKKGIGEIFDKLIANLFSAPRSWLFREANSKLESITFLRLADQRIGATKVSAIKRIGKVQGAKPRKQSDEKHKKTGWADWDLLWSIKQPKVKGNRLEFFSFS